MSDVYGKMENVLDFERCRNVRLETGPQPPTPAYYFHYAGYDDSGKEPPFAAEEGLDKVDACEIQIYWMRGKSFFKYLPVDSENKATKRMPIHSVGM